VAVLRRVSEEQPRPVRSLNPEVPAWLEALIARLMAKDPAERFEGAAGVAALLEAYLAHLQHPATVPAPPLPRLRTDRPAWLGNAAAPTRALERLVPRLRLATLVLLAAVGLALIVLAATGAAGETKLQAAYHSSLKGYPDDLPGLHLVGPDADACVRFEPTGLRISLPPRPGDGHPPTGVSTGIVVRGDFEITIRFDILRESVPKNAGGFGTRLSLMIEQKTTDLIIVKVSRGMSPNGESQFIAWSSLWQGGPKPQYRQKVIPTPAATGRLRLARTGSVLSGWVAEEASSEFTLLQQHPLSEEDCTDLAIIANTGSPDSTLEARVTDLEVRAESLPGLPAGRAAAPKAAGKGWWAGGLALGVGTTVASLLGLWVCVRRGRRAGRTMPAPAPDPQAGRVAATPALSVACPGCRKTLKVKGELAGKRVKCPHCHTLALVPRPQAGEASSAAS
jgi:LSD1 subclass zinc finger protein